MQQMSYVSQKKLEERKRDWGGIGLIVTIVVALVGYVATYLNNAATDARKADIELVNDQLENLYGPLLALSSSLDDTWQKFRCTFRPNHWGYFDDADPPSEKETADFRHWSRIVFLPTDIKMKDIIVNNAHLIEGVGMPEKFVMLVTHTQMFQAISEQWKPTDNLSNRENRLSSANISPISYPENIHVEVHDVFNVLKKRQECLLTKQGGYFPLSGLFSSNCRSLPAPAPVSEKPIQCPGQQPRR